MNIIEEFQEIVKEISDRGPSYEKTLESKLSKMRGKKKIITEAALCFVNGLDFSAVKIMQGKIVGAERIVRLTRIKVSDNPHLYNLPKR